jgi:hypothetical protein
MLCLPRQPENPAGLSALEKRPGEIWCGGLKVGSIGVFAPWRSTFHPFGEEEEGAEGLESGFKAVESTLRDKGVDGVWVFPKCVLSFCLFFIKKKKNTGLPGRPARPG